MISKCCQSSTILVGDTYFCKSCDKICFEKTKQCFCQSIYNGETNQVENCTCGKCADVIKNLNKSDLLTKLKEDR